MKRKVRKPNNKSSRTIARGFVTAAERRWMAAELGEMEERVALAALDSLSAQIAMLDAEGNLVAINKAWRDFAGVTAGTDRALPGRNYFEHCRGLSTDSGHFAELAQAVVTVISGKRSDFVIEYPCVTKTGEKWFHARVNRCDARGPVRVVIAHEDISDRVELERDIVAVSEREQQRFRQELHDGLSQQLTGLKFKASLLEYHLQSKNVPEASEAKALSQLLNEATEEASELARRIRPVEVESRGLMMALRELATNAEHAHELSCTITIARPVFIHDNNVATNLFRIAEEATNSAAILGEARKVHITLSETSRRVTLAVRDNGKPIKDRQPDGLGAHMMRYHARIIGGLLEWRSESPRGVTLTCCFQKRAPAPA
ncbi:MAG TPA: histidine kinase [Candidatus Acidoferrum sp.]|nr:histidine kinase [Candidatus Acidoferrum sp.]